MRAFWAVAYLFGAFGWLSWGLLDDGHWSTFDVYVHPFFCGVAFMILLVAGWQRVTQ